MISSGSSEHRASARLLTVVGALYLLFVFYGSWVPLHFVRIPLAEAVDRFLALPFLDQRIESATDWGTNFLLLIPLSFLWTQRFLGSRRGFLAVLGRLLLVATGIGIAFSLEFSQLYFPPRTVSQKDILALSLGSIVGSMMQLRWGAAVERWLNRVWQRESRRTRVVQLLHVYLLVLFVFNMLPLDLTISLVEVYHKWHEGRVILIPFQGLHDGLVAEAYSIATDLLVWLPVGIFLALERRLSLVGIAIAGLFLSAAIEAAQLFVYSRVSDTTDILLGGIGAFSGGLLIGGKRDWGGMLSGSQSRVCSVLWILWVLVVLGVFWFPFDFRLSLATPETAWAAFTRIPFLMLYQDTEFQAVNELLRKIGFFLPVGALWVLKSPAMERPLRGRVLGTLLIVVTLPLIVESGQLFIPGKYADLTDALLEAGGTLLGVVLARWVLGGHADHRETAPPGATNVSSPSFGQLNHLLTFIALSVAVGIVTRLPAMPYNFRELNASGVAGILTTFGLALAIYWIANGHFLFLKWAGPSRLFALPLWLIVHGAVAWLILRLMIPMESLQDIVGDPVLDASLKYRWAGEAEMAGRYLALHGAVALQAVGAILMMQLVFRRGNVAALLVWMMCSALLAWPLHLVVVEYAATDNLTELMRNGGSFWTSFVLAIGAFALFLSGISVAACFGLPGHRGKALAMTIASSLVAAAAFWFGSEPVIMKYDKVFSAWQFLLSTDRQHYAHGSALLIRYAVAYAATVSALGAIQLSHVQSFTRNAAFRVRPSAKPATSST